MRNEFCGRSHRLAPLPFPYPPIIFGTFSPGGSISGLIPYALTQMIPYFAGGAGARREELAGSRPESAHAQPGSVCPKMEEGSPVRDRSIDRI